MCINLSAWLKWISAFERFSLSDVVFSIGWPGKVFPVNLN